MFHIISLFIIVIIFILKPFSFEITPQKLNYKIFCDKFTGDWNGENCICKHHEFITNNFYNGNCDKIVDNNCKRILNLDGTVLDFNINDPLNEGICDCGMDYFYNKLNQKCELKKLNHETILRQSEANCEEGFYFNNKYKTCFKKLCYWDILNPNEKIYQHTISPTICKCSFENGFIPISLINGIVGCTKILSGNGWSKNHIILLEKINQNEDIWKIYHLYPLSALNSKLNRFFQSQDDNGSKMLAIEQSHENWLNDLQSKGVKIIKIDHYENYNKAFGIYDSTTNELTIHIKNE